MAKNSSKNVSKTETAPPASQPAPPTAPAPKRMLNVGIVNKATKIPPHYTGWELLSAGPEKAAKPDIVVDPRQLTTLPGGSFDAVYSAHNLQVYAPHDLGRVLAGFRHLLKPDGFVEIRVPDLGAIMRVAVERKLDIEDVLYTSPAGPVTVRDAIYGFARSVRAAPNRFAHHTGFSRKSLQGMLGAAGFAAAALLRPRALEIAVVAFPTAPSEANRALLKLKG